MCHRTDPGRLAKDFPLVFKADKKTHRIASASTRLLRPSYHRTSRQDPVPPMTAMLGVKSEGNSGALKMNDQVRWFIAVRFPALPRCLLLRAGARAARSPRIVVRLTLPQRLLSSPLLVPGGSCRPSCPSWARASSFRRSCFSATRASAAAASSSCSRSPTLASQ